MWQIFVQFLKLTICFTIFDLNLSLATSSQLTPGSNSSTSELSTSTNLPYCQTPITQSPLICGENCITVIQESDKILFFESLNFPLPLNNDDSTCFLNFVLNATNPKGVSRVGSPGGLTTGGRRASTSVSTFYFGSTKHRTEHRVLNCPAPSIAPRTGIS